GQLSAWLPNLVETVRGVEAVLTDSKVLEAALPAESGRLLTILERSQGLADGASLGGLTASSARLPGGHTARERDLASATQTFLEQPGLDRAAKVVEALKR